MRLSHNLFALLALPSLINAVTFDCKSVVIDKTHFDLSALSGEHVLHWNYSATDLLTKTWTFTLDICRPLKRTKGVNKAEECPSGTNICAIDYHTQLARNETVPESVIPVAGNFEHSGRYLDPVVTRLKGSDSSADAEKEGLRVQLGGGLDQEDGKNGVKQKAFIEFVCDPERTGLEGDEGDGRKKEEGEDALERREEEKKGDEEKETPKKSLQFLSYKMEDEIKVLRMSWRTKHACEGASSVPDNDKPAAKKGSWGFFTWFIIM